MTPPVEKPVKTSIENSVGALVSLQASTGWAIIVGIIDDNLAYLEKGILEKVDPITKEPLSEVEIETLRLKRGLNIELRNTPQKYTQAITKTGQLPKNYDPYYKNKEEIDYDRSNPNKDDQGK